jgi:dihydroorotate dehydrogenase electron transfer subunit
LFSLLKAGDSLDVIGPLGRGFDTAISGEQIYLIGGGMGIAPLIFLAQSLEKENDITAFFGGKNKEQLQPVAQLTSIKCELATEDGSIGHQGYVTDLLLRSLVLEKPARVYACGPNGMLEQTALITRKYNLPLQVSLESVMACGVGACLGCTCEKGLSGEEGWVKVCKDGPVFWEQEVKLL